MNVWVWVAIGVVVYAALLSLVVALCAAAGAADRKDRAVFRGSLQGSPAKRTGPRHPRGRRAA